MAQKHLQLLRNNTAYTSYTEALTALKEWNFTNKPLSDGTPVIARYTDNDNNQKTLLGVVNNGTMDIINNVSDYLLRNYAAFTGDSTEIAATDDVKTAIAKLEKHINDSIADTTVSVSATTDPNTTEHLSVSAQTVDGGADIYWLTLTDVASASALTAETSARETADEELSGRLGTGVTTANTATAQFAALSGNNSSTSSETSVEGAKRYTDEKIGELSGIVENLDATTVYDENKVVVDVTQEDGKISATTANLTSVKLGGYAEGTDADIAATDTLGDALGKLQAQINAMDKTASAADGQVVTTVAEEDGKVTETKANVKDLQLGGYVKDTAATGAISGTDTVNAALSKLENKIGQNTITNADGSINVVTTGDTTDVNVNIKSGEKVLAKDGNAGLYTDLDFVKITTGLPEDVKERYQFLATDNSQIGVNLDIPKDSHIVSINYITTGEHAQNLEYVYIDASGNTQTTYVDMSELVLEAEFASGVTVTDHVAHGVVDPTSETFLTVGADGFKLSGVQNAINTAISGLDVTDDAAVAGQYVAAIEETDGIVAVKTRANVSEAVLNNYVKGSDATAVAATDTVNAAISKLENQVDKAKAAATTKVVEGTDAGNNIEIVPTTSSTDSSVTYTINLTDVASKTALDAEIAARKAVDGQTGQTYASNTSASIISGATDMNDADVLLNNAITGMGSDLADEIAARKAVDGQSGQTYAANTSTNYITGATNLNNADVLLDTALKAEEDARKALSAKTFTAAAMTGGTVSTATTADGTVQLNINTDGSQVLLTGYQQGSESGAPVATDSVNAAISKLYNRTLATEVKAGSATTVSQAADGTTVDVKLDTESEIAEYDAGHAQAVNNTSKNVLEITQNGLYLNNNWDCGTY